MENEVYCVNRMNDNHCIIYGDNCEDHPTCNGIGVNEEAGDND